MKIKLVNIQEFICQIIYSRYNCLKPKTFHILSLIYNWFLVLISLIGLLPIIFSTIGSEKIESLDHLHAFFIATIIVCLIYSIDFILRIFTIKKHYHVKKLSKAIKRQLISIFANYQFLSSITIFILFICFSKNDNGIYFDSPSFCNDNALITFSFLIVVNFLSILPRIILKQTNEEEFMITWRIIISKRKSIIFTFIAMITMWIIFSFLVFVLERKINPEISTIGDAMYFCFIVMTTVGFGDIVPVSESGRITTIFLAIFGICFYGYVGSIFVNIYLEYINKKKQIRNEIVNTKNKEFENQKFFSDLEKLIIKNLYESGLITKNKYDQIIKNKDKRNATKIKYSFESLTFNDKEKIIFVNGKEIGKKNSDQNIMQNAKNFKWAIDLNSNSNESLKMNSKTILYKVNYETIVQISKLNSLPIFFSSKLVDYSDLERVILFSNKPNKAAYCELLLYCNLTLEKENAWKLFKNYVNLTESKYNSLFKRSDKVSILVVKEFINYPSFKCLEKFGINENSKIDNVIGLK